MHITVLLNNPKRDILLGQKGVKGASLYIQHRKCDSMREGRLCPTLITFTTHWYDPRAEEVCLAVLRLHLITLEANFHQFLLTTCCTQDYGLHMNGNNSYWQKKKKKIPHLKMHVHFFALNLDSCFFCSRNFPWLSMTHDFIYMTTKHIFLANSHYCFYFPQLISIINALIIEIIINNLLQ